jgi:hypothetical protein
MTKTLSAKHFHSVPASGASEGHALLLQLTGLLQMLGCLSSNSLSMQQHSRTQSSTLSSEGTNGILRSLRTSSSSSSSWQECRCTDQQQ